MHHTKHSSQSTETVPVQAPMLDSGTVCLVHPNGDVIVTRVKARPQAS